MNRIGFHVDSFSLRGVDQATYQYCLLAEEDLGLEVVVLRAHKRDSGWVSDYLGDTFRKRFYVVDYDGSEEGLRDVVNRERLEAVYVLSAGLGDKRFRCISVPVFRHSVFPTSNLDPEKDNFCVISDWLSREYFNRQAKVVNHVIPERQTDECLRSELGIPRDALVLGTMGGKFNFNSRLTLAGLEKVMAKRRDLWLLSLNQVICLKGENIRVMEGTGCELKKARFINTCDFMMHGRVDGETFGIACGEFCKAGKPIIAWTNTPQRAHIDQFLIDRYGYSNMQGLINLLSNLEVDAESQRLSTQLANRYCRENVGKQFKKNFMSSSGTKVSTKKSIDRIKVGYRYVARRVRVSWAKRDGLCKEEMSRQTGTDISE